MSKPLKEADYLLEEGEFGLWLGITKPGSEEGVSLRITRHEDGVNIVACKKGEEADGDLAEMFIEFSQGDEE